MKLKKRKMPLQKSTSTNQYKEKIKKELIRKNYLEIWKCKQDI